MSQTRRFLAGGTAALALTAALVATLPVTAQETPAAPAPEQAAPAEAMPAPMMMPGRMPFSELDADGDGSITEADLQAAADARFAAVDADGNGTVSPEEMTAHAIARMEERMAERSARMIEMLDADDDGALSQDELQAMHGGGDRGPVGAGLLQRADVDGDGAVSEAEYILALDRMRGHREDRMGGDRNFGHHGDPDGHRGGDRDGGTRGEGMGHQGMRPMMPPQGSDRG